MSGVVHNVYLLLPALPIGAPERLVAELHRADRRLGVAHGQEGEATRLILDMDEGDEDTARAEAERLVALAAERAGLAGEVGDRVEIDKVDRRRASPGRPRRVTAPAHLDYRAVEGLRVAHEGGLGNWIVQPEGEEAWTGRDLTAVLRELFAVPHGEIDPRVVEIVRRLTGRETPSGTRYPCPCCEAFTLSEAPSGTYEICPVCNWEDDAVQFADPDYRGGANTESLREARALRR